MEDLRQAVEGGNLVDCETVASRIISSIVPSSNGDIADDVFYAMCIQSTLRAIREDNIDKVRSVFGEHRPLGRREALCHYIEGTAKLTRRFFLDRAKTSFEECLKADPSFVTAFLGLGACAALSQPPDHRRAFFSFKQVLEKLGSLAPPLTRILMGVSALHLGKVEHAAKCFDRALTLDPNDPLALLGLISVRLRSNSVVGATEVVRQLYEIYPSTIVTQRFADVVFYKSLFDDDIDQQHEFILSLVRSARQSATRAQATAKRDAIKRYASLEAYSMLQEGRLLHCQGKLDDAKTCYEAAISKDPTLVAAKIHLAKTIFHTSGPDAALRHIVGILGYTLKEHLPQDKEVTSMAAMLFASLGFHESAIKSAQHLLDSAAVGDPASWSVAAWANRLNPAPFRSHLENAARLRARIGLPVDQTVAFNAAAVSGDPQRIVAVVKDLCGGVDISDPKCLNEHTEFASDPASIPLLYNFALLSEAAQPDHAKAYYKHLAITFPSSAEPFYRLSEIARLRGDLSGALNWLVLRIRVDPSDACALAMITSLMMMKGGTHDALDLAARLEGKDQVVSALCKGSILLARLQRTKDLNSQAISAAFDKFRYALAKDRSNVLAVHGIACCVALRGEAVSASLLFERVSESKTSDSAIPKESVTDHAFNVLVATRSYRKAMGQLHSRKDLRVEQMMAMACCNALIGEYDQAREASAAARKKQDSSLARDNEAIILLCLIIAETLKVDILSESRGQQLQKLWQEVQALRPKVKDEIGRLIARAEKLRVPTVIDRLVQRDNIEKTMTVKHASEWRDQISQLNLQQEEEIRRTQQEEAERKRQREERAEAMLRTQNWAEFGEDYTQQATELTQDAMEAMLGGGEEEAAFPTTRNGGDDDHNDEDAALQAMFTGATDPLDPTLQLGNDDGAEEG